MKVTAIIPDKLIKEVRDMAKENNLTESLIKALSEWTSLQKIRYLNNKLKKHPLKFKHGFSPLKLREINRY